MGLPISYSFFDVNKGNTPWNWERQQAVANSAPAIQRQLLLTSARADTGASLTATATGGAMGISRTAGTVLQLVGEVTSGNAKTNKALWEFDLPQTYAPGGDITVGVDCEISGSGTLTEASTTMTVNSYLESEDGSETALSVSAAQEIVAAGSLILFAISGNGLKPGDRIVVELIMLITSASGANTGAVNSVYYTA